MSFPRTLFTRTLTHMHLFSEKLMLTPGLQLFRPPIVTRHNQYHDYKDTGTTGTSRANVNYASQYLTLR